MSTIFCIPKHDPSQVAYFVLYRIKQLCLANFSSGPYSFTWTQGFYLSLFSLSKNVLWGSRYSLRQWNMQLVYNMKVKRIKIHNLGQTFFIINLLLKIYAQNNITIHVLDSDKNKAKTWILRKKPHMRGRCENIDLTLFFGLSKDISKRDTKPPKCINKWWQMSLM